MSSMPLVLEVVPDPCEQSHRGSRFLLTQPQRQEPGARLHRHSCPGKGSRGSGYLLAGLVLLGSGLLVRQEIKQNERP